MIRALVKMAWLFFSVKVYSIVMDFIVGISIVDSIVDKLPEIKIALLFAILILGFDIIDAKVKGPFSFIRNAIIYLIALVAIFKFTGLDTDFSSILTAISGS